MDFNKLQKEVYQNKLDHNFNVTDINLEFCLTYGELAEAYEAWLKKEGDVGEEMADVIIFLMGIAEILHIDLGDKIIKKIEKNKNRKNKRVNGVLVKEEGEK